MKISVGLKLTLSTSAASSSLLNGYPNVDDANTRSDWATKYKPGKAGLIRWIPSGLSCMKLDHSPIPHEHLITLATGQHLYTENLGGLERTMARFFNS
ncbi:hypothetical protein NUW58_g2367 [Xylaria curta]|uniref:Uncharacterized protein n=1 Tax=Xylaria curta TaxID=42375 RepID=A0ACC1PIE2_9PEZI|nr:hypothetical protein NUW58_g2367 [Xylaria curta]